MWREVILLVVACVLFVNMGLSDAIQETLNIRFRIVSCVKCLCFWVSLIYLLVCRCRFVTAVGASFLLSYLALWADLGLSALNRKYNEIYKQLSKPKTAKEYPGKTAKTDSPNVSPVRKKKW